MEQRNMQSLYERLKSERTALEQQLSDLGATVSGDRVDMSVDEGFADSAAATAERSEMLSLVDQLSSTYSDVVDALRKIDEGTYGRCERCGNEIAPERLEAIPYATQCIDCRRKGERG
jgi:RNA polymerase-binding protein DksA